MLSADMTRLKRYSNQAQGVVIPCIDSGAFNLAARRSNAN
jgi:hypothetical protein